MPMCRLPICRLPMELNLLLVVIQKKKNGKQIPENVEDNEKFNIAEHGIVDGKNDSYHERADNILYRAESEMQETEEKRRTNDCGDLIPEEQLKTGLQISTKQKLFGDTRGDARKNGEYDISFEQLADSFPYSAVIMQMKRT